MRLSADLIARAHRVPVEAVLEAHGITTLRGRIERVGPCPLCGGTDRFAANIRKQVFNCRGCGASGDSIALERFLSGSNFAEAVASLSGEPWRPSRTTGRIPTRYRGDAARHPRQAEDEADNRDAALRLWREGAAPRGTLVEVYLRSRGLDLGDDLAGDVLRWHPRLGAMIALFRDIDTDEPRAVSRTCLDRNGQKIRRAFLGPAGGAAIKFDADETVLGGLHIGEGVETCMAARQLGLRPTWALGSKGAIAAFPVLGGIDCLTILAEPDAAAEVEGCAGRWDAAGKEVFINHAIGGKDLADAIRGRP